MVAFGCLFLGGCGAWIGDPVVEIIGEVTLDRQVLTDAFVVFVPMRFRDDDGLILPLAFGKTDKTGRFELSSEDQKGVLLGQYRVLIFKPDSVIADSEAVPGNAMIGLWNEPKAAGETGVTVPAGYNLESELVYEVKRPEGVLYPKFQLTSN